MIEIQENSKMTEKTFTTKNAKKQIKLKEQKN